MAGISAPPPPPPPPPPPQPMPAPLGGDKCVNKKRRGRGNGNNAEAKSSLGPPKCFIPTPPILGYRPFYGANAYMVRVRPPTGYGQFLNFIPPRPQVAMNGVLQNKNVTQGTRRGTGVFHPSPSAKNKPIPKLSNSIGKRNKQGAEVTIQTKENDSSDKEDESDEALCAKLGLPLEWAY